MILWAKARNEEFKSITDRAYAILKTLKEFGAELSPNYLRAWRKKDAKPFDWTYKTLEELLRKGVNKEGKHEFVDLGYGIGFFSSLIDKDSAGISILVGTTNPQFKNTLLVNLPLTLPIYENHAVVEKLNDLFKKSVLIFEPYWGCIGNNINIKRYNGYWCNSLPTSVHWINYFGEKIVKQIGIQKFEQVPVNTIEALNKGFFIRIKDLPIDDFSKEDVKMQEYINRYLGL